MATPSLTRHTLPGVLGPIQVDVRTSDRHSPRPAVVILPGFKGFKEWGMFPALAERVARAGFTAVAVNVSGCGVNERGEFAYPERFGHNAFSIELRDIRRVLDVLEQGTLGLAPTTILGLVGHSRGGGLAILAARADPRVQALVTWAAIATTNRWLDRAAQWRAAGKLDIVNTRTGEVLPLYLDVLEDIEQHREALDIQAAAAALTTPWLLVHGSDDQAVPLIEGRTLAAAASAHPPRFMIVENAGHTFGAVHPFAGISPDLAQVFDETMKWLGRHL
ncbi:MAG: alpha/beta fold hydrolase [Gemmatimonadales bacterium]